MFEIEYYIVYSINYIFLVCKSMYNVKYNIVYIYIYAHIRNVKEILLYSKNYLRNQSLFSSDLFQNAY